MAKKKLARTTYRDPTLPGNPPRSGDTTHGESALDMEEYYQPLEQIHAGGLHEWGVASGLRVMAKLGNPDVSVEEGYAMDVAGRHIALASGGNAEVGPNADAPGTPATLAGVTAAGVAVPTAGQSGPKYLTVQWWETFDTDAYNTSYGAVYRYNHTPWLRLLPAAGFADDGTRVVLAKVTLDAAGNVTGLTHELRRGTGAPVEGVRLRRGQTASPAPNFAVDDVAAGELRARPTGGINLTVPNSSDEIVVSREGDYFAKLSVGAAQIVARRPDGLETVAIDTRFGNLTAGTKGVEGDIFVKDAFDRTVVTVDGKKAQIVVGVNGNEGHIRLKGREGVETVHIDGAPGDIWFRGKLQDYHHSHTGVGHDLLKHLFELTGGGVTHLHKHDLGALGWWGETGTRIGIIGGDIGIFGSGHLTGGVTLDFASGNFSGGSGGFRGDASGSHGYHGVFTAAPHVMIEPSGFNLTTGYVFFWNWLAAIDTTKITVGWEASSGSDVWRALRFLVIGPIA
jgi:hypothetical protein